MIINDSKVLNKIKENQKEKHNFDDGVVITPATPFKSGEACVTCTDCGFEKLEVIGQNVTLLILIAVAIVLVIIISIIIIILSQKKHRRS